MAADDKTPEIVEGPGKGKLFFDRAKTVAETGNYDYAIDMYIDGLLREPTEVSRHEELRQVGLRRKVTGGKPAGGIFGPKLPTKGKSHKEKMLNAEWLLAKDPGNITHMVAMMKAADAAGYADIIRWFGPTLKIANKQKPKKEIYLDMCTWYQKIDEFELAADSVQLAVELAPLDQELQSLLKNVAAQHALKRGNYEKEENFKGSLKDVEKTKELLQEDALSKSLEFRAKDVERSRLEYQAAPKDHRAISKYVSSLRSMEEKEYEDQAVAVLQEAYTATDSYQYKRTIGEIKMRQYARMVSAARENERANPEDAVYKERLRALLVEQLTYELETLKDWSEHYPTDMGIMYDYGTRLFKAKRFDDAINAFQQSQVNPNKRISSLYYLGLSFGEHHMYPEALDTFKTAVSEYDLIESGNDMSKQLYYALGRVQEKTDNYKEAIAIYSKITRWEIGYKDARARLAELRKKAG